MTGITSIVKLSFAGPELIREVRSINGFLESLQKPFVAILGGAKITTKLPLLNFLATKADYVLLGGALANTVFASQGMNTGKSLIEESLLGEAKKLTSEKFVLPIDAVVTGGKIVDIDSIGASQAMLDIGPRTIKKFVQQLKDAKTILWNGPMGKYEDDKYSKGTFEIAHYMAEHQSSNSLSGGGETVEVIERLGLVDSFDFVSTGGGAMLTMLSGEEMPALEALY
jgi:phosphoglycerate kinase